MRQINVIHLLIVCQIALIGHVFQTRGDEKERGGKCH